MNAVRVILADNQYLTRFGLKCLLGSQENIEIIGEAENEAELLDLVNIERPHLVIIDYFQQDHFSVSTLRKLQSLSPSIKLMVITADNNKHRIYNVIEKGVSGFLTKTCEKKEILDAIFSITQGQRSFCNKILELILERSFAKPGDECAPTPLSDREIEVVKLISRGLIAKEIAGLLNLSTHTIYTHRKNIMKKLNLGSSSELVLYAVNSGILQ
ncbi:MAG: response regulator transcription factor [Saprospiraceae bacterium]|nr:response regulator transcription factor [Saprospiraceae bacterium]MCB9323205.1 response regulator transcription factor [Lewinellaceae bacterium]